jgi:hypothetical protein
MRIDLLLHSYYHYSAWLPHQCRQGGRSSQIRALQQQSTRSADYKTSPERLTAQKAASGDGLAASLPMNSLALFVALTLSIYAYQVSAAVTYPPVVLVHGITGTKSDLYFLRSFLIKNLPGVYVRQNSRAYICFIMPSIIGNAAHAS